LIVDRDATRANIIKGLTWLDQATTQHDVAMLYLSGHGWRDQTNDYYFLASDTHVKDIQAEGVLWSVFTKAVGNVSSRGRFVFLLDTCHAGGITGNVKTRDIVDSTALIKELSSVEVGAVVLAAASGRHVALESSEWGGGAFTNSLVSGLHGEADLDHDDVLTLKELDYFMSQRVKKLTEGKQQTVSGWPTTLPDFAIAIFH